MALARGNLGMRFASEFRHRNRVGGKTYHGIGGFTDDDSELASIEHKCSPGTEA